MKRKAPEPRFEVKVDSYGRQEFTPIFREPTVEKVEKEEEHKEVKNLTARTERIELDKIVGKNALTSSDAAKGFYCDNCEVQFNDSSTYLDHMNSRKHYQRLGISMKVERSTADRVKAKLKKAKAIEKGEVANPTFEDIEKKIEKEEQQRKKKKKKVIEKQLEEAIDFDTQEIVAFGLPGDFSTSKKK